MTTFSPLSPSGSHCIRCSASLLKHKTIELTGRVSSITNGWKAVTGCGVTFDLIISNVDYLASFPGGEIIEYT